MNTQWTIRLLVATAVVTIVVGVLQAGRQVNGGKIVAPQDVKWPAPAAASPGTSGVAAIQTVVLNGDPTKPGLYTLLLRLGPNQKIAAHMHPDDRVATVMSGTWYFGYGREFNEASLRALPPGSFYTEPPNVHHFAMTKDDGATLQIVGMGPSGTSYADPANDPTRKP